jgi:hypothetical protein
VEVEEGIVEVVPAAGEVQRLTAGMTSQLGPANVTPSAPLRPAGERAPAPGARQPSVATHPTPRPSTRPPVSAQDVRGALHRGSASDARALLEEARAEAAIDAELALAEAETLQAEGRPREALEAYLSVSERFPRASAAEDALFAAAQLAVLHGGPAHPPQPLLREYLRRHPNGRYRAETLRLLEAVQGGASPPP